MPSFLILLDGSFVRVTGLLEGVLDGANAIDEMLLSLLAWFFAFRPWELCSASFGVPFEFFILGVETLELLSTWNLLEPLEVLALLVELPVELIISMLTWWQVLPCKSSSSLDKDIMDPLNTEQETFMPDPFDTWFERDQLQQQRETSIDVCLIQFLTLCETSLHLLRLVSRGSVAGMCSGAQLTSLSGVCRIWCTQLSLSCARLWDSNRVTESVFRQN